jgi:hypothetical protein
MRGGGVVGGGVVIGGGVITRGGGGVLVGTVTGTDTDCEYAADAHRAAIADATVSDLRKKPEDLFIQKPL